MSTDWDQLYRDTYEDLVRFLYRKVWDEERARDLAQEVFVRALRHRPEKARAWVFVTAANLARDEARTVIRRRKHLALIKAESSEAEEVPTVGTEERNRVQVALDALSDRDRDALLLWDAGLSYDEIAAQTGLAKGAVGTTLSRARKRLVAAYKEKEGEDVAHR
ncbi:MAG: sigma-70 family RNA polymerase sigma factor [Gemmatimonadota bacterium]|nr:sigma-70 family RNA polymerase sigma factor [Gemmatimonadota bacterium]